MSKGFGFFSRESNRNQDVASVEDKRDYPFKWFIVEKICNANFKIIFGTSSRSAEEINFEIYRNNIDGTACKIFGNSTDSINEKNTILEFSSNGFLLRLANIKELKKSGKELLLDGPDAMYNLVHPNGEVVLSDLDYEEGTRSLKAEAERYQASQMAEFERQKALREKPAGTHEHSAKEILIETIKSAQQALAENQLRREALLKDLEEIERKKDREKNPFKWFLLDEMSDESFRCLFGEKTRDNISLAEINELCGNEHSGENGERESLTLWSKFDLEHNNVACVSSSGFALVLAKDEVKKLTMKNPKETTDPIFILVNPKWEAVGEKKLTYEEGKLLLGREAVEYHGQKLAEFEAKKAIPADPDRTRLHAMQQPLPAPKASVATPQFLPPDKTPAAERNTEIEAGVEDDDSMYEDAKALVLEFRNPSTSLLQRRLRIEYRRAAALIDMMEARGVVAPAEEGKPRKILENTPKTENPTEHLTKKEKINDLFRRWKEEIFNLEEVRRDIEDYTEALKSEYAIVRTRAKENLEKLNALPATHYEDLVRLYSPGKMLANEPKKVYYEKTLDRINAINVKYDKELYELQK